MKQFFFAALLLCILAPGQISAQPGTDTASFRANWESFLLPRYLINSPDSLDHTNYERYGHLIHQLPDSGNYDRYCQLACSLWELSMLEEAEKMFTVILHSKEKFYTNPVYHNSDIPGDNSSPVYGYGSYASSYKNCAAGNLARICIRKKRYSEALQYLRSAMNEYPSIHTCGTGHAMQKEKEHTLLAYCYEGLKRYEDLLSLYFDSSSVLEDSFAVIALKHIYSPSRIREELKKAEKSIHFQPDSNPIFGGMLSYTLFGRKIKMLILGEDKSRRITKKMAVRKFRESGLYSGLIRIAGA